MTAAAGEKIREETHYEVLGVGEDATTGEIRAAWRALIRDIHPDRETEPSAREAATRRAQEINAAYTTLSGAQSRSRYDAKIRAWREEHRRGGGGRSEQGRADRPPPGPQPGHDEPAGDAGTAEEDWEWIYEQAEKEAEAAWERWENPSARDRFREGLDEIVQWGAARFSFFGPMYDYAEASADLERGRPGVRLTFTLAGFSTVMVSFAAGELAVAGLGTLFGGGGLVGLLAAALLADMIFTMTGARPLTLVAHWAGAGSILSEGDRLAGRVALGLRALWAGALGLVLAAIPLSILGWLLDLVVEGPWIRPTLTLTLVLAPLIWTLGLLITLAVRRLRLESAEDQSQGYNEPEE